MSSYISAIVPSSVALSAPKKGVDLQTLTPSRLLASSRGIGAVLVRMKGRAGELYLALPASSARNATPDTYPDAHLYKTNPECIDLLQLTGKEAGCFHHAQCALSYEIVTDGAEVSLTLRNDPVALAAAA